MATVLNVVLLFTSRKKNLDFCSTFEMRFLVESMYIKTNGLFQYKTRTTEWFDNFFQNALRKSIL